MQQVLFDEKMDGITIDRIRREDGFSMPSKHLHDAYEIYYLLDGKRYYFIEKQTYEVTGGCLVFINRRQAHQTSQAGGGSHDRILIGLQEEPFSSFFCSTGELKLEDFFEKHWGVLRLAPEERPFVEGLLMQLADELHEKAAGYRLAAQAALARLILFAARRMTGAAVPAAPVSLSTTARHRKVNEVAGYIVNHYREPLSLETVADRFFVSKCYLSRIFKEVTGFTVNEYIHLNRIREAQRLLSCTSLNITEVSEALGYDTITYFERVFKKFSGTTPLKYRLAYRGRMSPVRPEKYEGQSPSPFPLS